MDSNQLKIDFKNNTALAALFADLKPGDKVSLEISVQIKEVTADGATAVIEKVMSDEEGAEEATPEPDQPMRMDIGGGMPMASTGETESGAE